MNQKLFFSMLFLLGTGLFSSCREVAGQLDVVENLQITTKKSDSWCNPENVWENCEEEKILTLIPNSYEASLDVQSKNEALLKIKVNSKDESVLLKLPKGKEIPERSGAFSATAGELRQAWDLSGVVDTQQSQSQIYRERERCEYEIQRRVCTPYGPPNYGEYCRIESILYPGFQHVEYYYKIQDKTILINLLRPQTSYSLAQWTGRVRYTDKIYTHKGICR